MVSEMTARAYYNEHDPFAAAWLRELIKEGLIAPGDVDERSIEDVYPDDLSSYTQCHFFAGIGIWSLALRQAGMPDDRPVWTGSCPCQPFSAAGQGGGFADERHLWPAFFHLIEQCRPDLVFGEQVASKDGLAWLDLVQADLEGAHYATGAVDTCAAGFGAPHIRQRLYWVADASSQRYDGWRPSETRTEPGAVERPKRFCNVGGLAHHHHEGLEGWRQPGRECAIELITRPGSLVSGLADDNGDGCTSRREVRSDGQEYDAEHGGSTGGAGRYESYSDWFGICFAGDDPRCDSERGCLCRDYPAPDGWEWNADNGWTETSRLADDTSVRRRQKYEDIGGIIVGDRAQGFPAGFSSSSSDYLRGPVNGLWSASDWLRCRDDKWRPVEPGTFPLAHAGAFRNRVGLLRGAGNAINLAQAQSFIEAYLEFERPMW